MRQSEIYQTRNMMAHQMQVIKEEYLNEELYFRTTEHSNSLNRHFEAMCSQFQDFYTNLKFVNETTLQSYNPQHRSNYHFENKFSEFVGSLVGTLAEIASFQAQCFQGLKNSAFPDLAAAEQVRLELQDYKKLYSQLLARRNELNSQSLELRTAYTKYKQIFHNAVQYYNLSISKQSANQLLERIARSQKILNDLAKKKTEVTSLCERFQQPFSRYRKKLVQNKYVLHHRIYQLSHNSQQSLVEMMSMLGNCIKTNWVEFDKVCAVVDDDIVALQTLAKRRQRTKETDYFLWEKTVAACMVEFEQTVDKISRAVNRLSHCVKNISLLFVNEVKIQRKVAEQFQKYFENGESLQGQLVRTIELVELIGNGFQRVHEQIQNFNRSLFPKKVNCKKHGQIILSLIKVNRKSETDLVALQQRESDSNMQFIKLVDNINFKEVKMVLKSILKIFGECLHEVVLSFQKKMLIDCPRLNDSMEISSAVDKYVAPVKRPMPNELWLWRQWHVPVEFNFTHYTNLFQDIQNVVKEVQSHFLFGSYHMIEKHQCTLIGKEKLKGVMHINDKTVTFESTSVSLAIPYKEIDAVEIQAKLFDQLLLLKTKNGVLSFSGFLSVKKAQESVSECIIKQQTSGVKIVKRPKVILSQQQLDQIEARMPTIASQLPQISQFKKFTTLTFSNEEIESIYEIFFSDNPFTFYGKQQACFFTYCGKKAGNYDWQASKYDKPGPKFYTLNENTTFSNCPVYSQRSINYKHPMPSIPFMPSFCNNEEYRRLYWISHEEFIYLIHSQTVGIALSDKFFVQLLMRLKQIRPDVVIEVYFRIAFRKDASFKGMIISQTEPLIAEGLTFILGEMQKLLKLRKTMATTGQSLATLEPVQQPKTANRPNDEIIQLKNRNKILLVVCLLLLLFNLVSKMFL